MLNSRCGWLCPPYQSTSLSLELFVGQKKRLQTERWLIQSFQWSHTFLKQNRYQYFVCDSNQGIPKSGHKTLSRPTKNSSSIRMRWPKLGLFVVVTVCHADNLHVWVIQGPIKPHGNKVLCLRRKNYFCMESGYLFLLPDWTCTHCFCQSQCCTCSLWKKTLKSSLWEFGNELSFLYSLSPVKP